MTEALNARPVVTSFSVWLWEAGQRHSGVTDHEDDAKKAAVACLLRGEKARVERAAYVFGFPVSRYWRLGVGWEATRPWRGPVTWEDLDNPREEGAPATT
jgi:hypothetical protein